eukprot:gnl/MRDRNA2_/MRDRNA2_23987_c0_seq1.p1 gnl/MRDRNA2_/MRDRNA2_23987_c0~~gnl/MRDRNA2_/MRDRNA2_23987_c0_seq1.p1  ORF type:complete len:245 (+),score=53.06 gnl/MRDRNA2_/MRDRNA2_23987_c0_seq1:63-797(+)
MLIEQAEKLFKTSQVNPMASHDNPMAKGKRHVHDGKVEGGNLRSCAKQTDFELESDHAEMICGDCSHDSDTSHGKFQNTVTDIGNLQNALGGDAPSMPKKQLETPPKLSKAEKQRLRQKRHSQQRVEQRKAQDEEQSRVILRHMQECVIETGIVNAVYGQGAELLQMSPELEVQVGPDLSLVPPRRRRFCRPRHAMTPQELWKDAGWAAEESSQHGDNGMDGLQSVLMKCQMILSRSVSKAFQP